MKLDDDDSMVIRDGSRSRLSVSESESDHGQKSKILANEKHPVCNILEQV